jgi:hypothetical protein
LFPVTFSDDFEPVHGDGVEESRIRNNSSIHIKIKFNPKEKEKQKEEAASAVQQEP